MSGAIPLLRLHALVTCAGKASPYLNPPTQTHIQYWLEITDLLISDSVRTDVCMLLKLRHFLKGSEIPE